MGDRANDNLPLICGECGGGPVRAVRAIDRVLIRCSACKKRLFAYYLDPARAGDIPPEREDEFLARLDERERIKKLSANAQALYEVLRRYHRHFGYAPSLREMQLTMGWESTSPVRRALTELVEVGLVERDFATARGIRLVYAA